MLVFEGLEKVDDSLAGCALTIGNYDGVHRAHQELLSTTRQLATAAGSKAVVLTFEPHPLAILRPASAPARLTTSEEKTSLLAAAGVDAIVVAKSEPRLLGLTPKDFVDSILMAKLRPKHIVEGPSFGFGRRREGTPESLRELAAPFGCEVHVLDPVHLTLGEAEKVMVSSSLIRNLLNQGRVGDAVTCLGRGYSISAEVVAGDGRGRTIGFPTANLGECGKLVPAEGVYAGRAIVGDEQHVCAISIGKSPTFDGEVSRVEAHVLDFSGDLYGKKIRVFFQRFLRPQQKYGSASALVDQLERDVAATRKLSTKVPEETIAPAVE